MQPLAARHRACDAVTADCERTRVQTMAGAFVPISTAKGTKPMTCPPVPEFEPEVVMATADRLWKGDPEKVATTSVTGMVHRGVALNSRYGKAHEYRAMMRILDALTEEDVRAIASVFCDSKAEACYVLRADVADARLQPLAEAFSNAGLSIGLGNNGITVFGRQPDGSFREGLFGGSGCASGHADPDWGEEF
jgi:hypothetical protein